MGERIGDDNGLTKIDEKHGQQVIPAEGVNDPEDKLGGTHGQDATFVLNHALTGRRPHKLQDTGEVVC